MTLDLLSTVGITAGATVLIATFVALFGSSLTQRLSIGTLMALWFTGVLWVRGAGNHQYIAAGCCRVIPIVVLSVIGFGSIVGRCRLQSAPLPR